MEWLLVIGGVAAWFLIYHVANLVARMFFYVPIPQKAGEAEFFLHVYLLLSISAWLIGAKIAKMMWPEPLMWIFNTILIVYGAWTALFYWVCAKKRLAFIKSRTLQDEFMHNMLLMQKIDNGRIDEVSDSELNDLFGEQVAQIVRETEEKKKQRKNKA